jgi:hypothetical protein
MAADVGCIQTPMILAQEQATLIPRSEAAAPSIPCGDSAVKRKPTIGRAAKDGHGILCWIVS